MNEITALAILTAVQYPDDRVGVVCKNPKEVQSSAQRYIGVSCFKNMVFFELKGDERSGKLRGYRFNIILVEGSEDDITDQVKEEVVQPMLSVCYDPSLCERLSQEIGVTVPPRWIKQPKVIFSSEKSLKRIKKCESCSHMVNIDSEVARVEHAKYCNYVWGRRGWRQLGAYDG